MSNFSNFTNITTSFQKELPFELEMVRFLNTKILTIQIIFGCGGNVLNLMVLLSRAMRSRTNLIFAAMAIADLFFFLLNIPTVLFFAGILMNSEWYRNSFNQINAGMCNWLSAVSIWFMMYATIERVQVFRSPFRTSKRNASKRFFGILLCIIVVSFLLTFVHFFPNSNRSICKPYLVLLHIICVVVIPVVVSTFLNILLVLALRRNTMPLRMLNDSNIHQTLIVQRNRTERKVTLMVIVIITSFIICNTPGAAAFLIRERDSFLTRKPNLDDIMIRSICNSLAVTGKVLNFLLFCLSSEHFRALLKKRLCYLLHFNLKEHGRHTCSTTATKTFSVPLNDL